MKDWMIYDKVGDVDMRRYEAIEGIHITYPYEAMRV